jgi:hypothetical protein
MGISLTLLIVLRGLGFFFHSSLNFVKPLKLHPVNSPAIDYPIIGIFVIVVVGFHAAYFGLDVTPFFRALLLISLIGFGVECQRKKIGVIRDYLFYNLIGLWIVLPQLFISGQKNSTNPVISLGNHDIAYYLAAASQFLQSGFVNQGAVNLNDLNVAARNYQYFTPTALFAFERSNSPIWIGQFATPTLIVFITLGSLIVAKISKMISPRINKFQQFSISTIFSLMSINIYILTSFFLAQAIAVMIILRIVQILLAEVLDQNSEINSRIDLLVIAIMALCVFSYPALLFPALALLIIGLSAASIRKRSLANLIRLVLSSGLAVVVTLSYLPTAINLFVILKDGSFGWPLQPLSPIAMILTPSLIGAPLTKVSLIFMWTLFFLVLFILISKAGLDRIERTLIGLVISAAVLLVIVFAEFRGEGYSNYGVWKLQSYIAPFTTLLVLAYILKRKNIFDSLVYTLLGVVLLNPLIIWTVNSGKSTSNTFMQLYNTRELNNSQSLNIDLKDFSETMLATTFGKGNKFFINSNSYLQTSLDPNSCTLTNAGSNGYAFQVPINPDYVMASQDPNECSQWLEVERRKPLLFNDTLSSRFGSGWWQSENWGTWSRSLESYVYLKPNVSNKRDEFTLRVKFNTLRDETANGVDISIFLNGKLYFEGVNFDYTKSHSVDLKVVGDEAKSDKLSIKFVSNKLSIPAITSEVSDSRALGIGLKSIELL